MIICYLSEFWGDRIIYIGHYIWPTGSMFISPVNININHYKFPTFK